VLDKTGSLPVSFPVKIIYHIVSYRIVIPNVTFSETLSCRTELYSRIREKWKTTTRSSPGGIDRIAMYVWWLSGRTLRSAAWIPSWRVNNHS